MVNDMRDCKGVRCTIGDRARLGNNFGKIEWDEFEGTYIALDNGIKRRLVNGRFEIIKKAKR